MRIPVQPCEETCECRRDLAHHSAVGPVVVVELRGVHGGAAGPPAEGFEVAYIEQCGSELRQPQTDGWAVRVEDAAPVREFHSYKGQRHLPGSWWSSAAVRHIGYKSWLERDHVMLLDFDVAVVGLSSQPFWLFWTGGNGKGVSHAPDCFARRDDGSAIVIDDLIHQFNRHQVAARRGGIISGVQARRARGQNQCRQCGARSARNRASARVAAPGRWARMCPARTSVLGAVPPR